MAKREIAYHGRHWADIYAYLGRTPKSISTKNIKFMWQYFTLIKTGLQTFKIRK